MHEGVAIRETRSAPGSVIYARVFVVASGAWVDFITPAT